MKDMFLDVFGGGAFKGIYDLLNIALLGGSKYDKASDLVENVYDDLMVPIALALMMIFFVCTLIEKSTNEQFTYEQMFLLFAKLVVCVFLIDKGFDLMVEFQKVGLSFLKDFKGYTDELGMNGGGLNVEDDPDLRKLYKEYTGVTWPDEPGFFDAIKNLVTGRTLTLVLAWGFTFVVKVVVYLIVFMRILEIFIRSMFAPIALSDVFYNGLNSTGFRFLKCYLAVSPTLR